MLTSLPSSPRPSNSIVSLLVLPWLSATGSCVGMPVTLFLLCEMLAMVSANVGVVVLAAYGGV